MNSKVLRLFLIVALINLTLGCKIMETETITRDEMIDDIKHINEIYLKNDKVIIFDENGGEMKVLEPAIEGNTNRGFKRLPISAITNIEWINSISSDSILSGSSEEYLACLKQSKEAHNQSILVTKASTYSIEYVFDIEGGRYVDKDISVVGYTSNGSKVLIDKTNILTVDVKKTNVELSVLATIGLLTVVAGVYVIHTVSMALRHTYFKTALSIFIKLIQYVKLT